MALRKGHCYTAIERPYTRKSKVKSKSYIKTIPPVKIAKFTMGDSSGFAQGKYNYRVMLVMAEPIQIRDNAIEAARILAHRALEDRLKGNYYFVVSAYPHHILRENKMLTGAGADRMQKGMQLSFGKPIGVAAQLDSGKAIFTVMCQKEAIPIVREILEKVKTKLPGKKTMIVEKINER